MTKAQLTRRRKNPFLDSDATLRDTQMRGQVTEAEKGRLQVLTTAL